MQKLYTVLLERRCDKVNPRRIAHLPHGPELVFPEL